jgi:O-6-methylguanine DNA methyltransferase
MLLRSLAFSSPLGWLIMAEGEGGICFVEFFGPQVPSDSETASAIAGRFPKATLETNTPSELLARAKTHILDYMDNGRPIPALPLDLSPGAPFERAVWEAIRAVPFGETRSYLQIAQTAGSPRAVRAAGRACGRNPVPIIVPCHRVVRSDGGLGGYTGGVHLKQALLEIEQKGAGNIRQG